MLNFEKFELNISWAKCRNFFRSVLPAATLCTETIQTSEFAGGEKVSINIHRDRLNNINVSVTVKWIVNKRWGIPVDLERYEYGSITDKWTKLHLLVPNFLGANINLSLLTRTNRLKVWKLVKKILICRNWKKKKKLTIWITHRPTYPAR